MSIIRLLQILKVVEKKVKKGDVEKSGTRSESKKRRSLAFNIDTQHKNIVHAKSN